MSISFNTRRTIWIGNAAFELGGFRSESVNMPAWDSIRRKNIASIRVSKLDESGFNSTPIGSIHISASAGGRVSEAECVAAARAI